MLSLRMLLRLFILGLSLQAFSQTPERMGSFSINEVFINPALEFAGEEDGGFLLRESFIGFKWSRGDNVSAVLNLGSSDLVMPAVFFNKNANLPSFGLSEVFMEGESRIGVLRVGLVPTHFGFEASFAQWRALLPPHLVAQDRWFSKRDYGVQFAWDSTPWEMSITAHNGESTMTQDGRFWASGHWLYSGSRDGGFRLLISAQTGQSKASSTNLSEAPAKGFSFDSSAPAKIRQGQIALIYEWDRSLVLFEGHHGQLIQKDVRKSFGGGRFESIVHLGGDLGLMLRHEKIAPDQGNVMSNRSADTAGVVLHSKDQLYSFSIYGTALKEEPDSNNNVYGAQFRIRSHLH